MQKYALCKSGECKLKDYWEIRPAKLHPSDQQKFKRAITPIVSKDEKKGYSHIEMVEIWFDNKHFKIKTYILFESAIPFSGSYSKMYGQGCFSQYCVSMWKSKHRVVNYEWITVNPWTTSLNCVDLYTYFFIFPKYALQHHTSATGWILRYGRRLAVKLAADFWLHGVSTPNPCVVQGSIVILEK